MIWRSFYLSKWQHNYLHLKDVRMRSSINGSEGGEGGEGGSDWFVRHLPLRNRRGKSAQTLATTDVTARKNN